MWRSTFKYLNRYSYYQGLGNQIDSIQDWTWIVTSARCVADVADIVALIGAFDLDQEDEDGVAVRHPIEIILHPDYQSSPVRNDIALLRIEPVLSNQSMSSHPVLATQSRPFLCSQCNSNRFARRG